MTDTPIPSNEALDIISTLHGRIILEAQRTYAYFLAIRTDVGNLIIETPWTLYQDGKPFLDIKTEEYGKLQPKADTLVNLTLQKIEVEPEKNVTLLTFSENFTLEIYHEDEFSTWSVQLKNDKCWLEYRPNKTFYRAD